MNFYKILGAVLLATGGAAHADDNATWMCLFEKVPVSVSEPSQMIADEKLKVALRNDLDFPVSKVAVDFLLASESGRARFEQNIVFPFPANLQPGETREIVAYLSIPDGELAALTHDDLSARAATANVLDQDEKRLVMRENLGAAFQVFWPFQPRSDQACR